MRDQFTSRLFSVALVVAALLTLDAKVGHVQATIRQPAGEPVPVQDVADGPL
jgi:hypothetical protein